jgi:transcriptional regulator with PAS, ATPase and Fis domain
MIPYQKKNNIMIIISKNKFIGITKMFFKNNIEKPVYEKSEELKEVKSMIEKLKILTLEISSKDSMIESIQEDYKKIFNLFSDIIVIIDKTGTVIDTNNSCVNSFINFFEEPLIGRK